MLKPSPYLQRLDQRHAVSLWCLVGLFAAMPFTAGHAQDAVAATQDPAVISGSALVASEDALKAAPNAEEPPVTLETEDVFFDAAGASDGATVYFDAQSPVPTVPVRPENPVDVDPAIEPGSRFVIVDTEHKANSSEALLVSAQRAVKLGRYDAAMEMYNRLYVMNDRDPRILMGRAIVMQHLGQFDAAMQAYDEFLEIEEGNVDARVNMLGLLGTKYPAVALQRLEVLRGEYPSHAGVVAQLAVNYGQLGDFSSAILNLEMASSLEPRNAGHVFNMGIMADRSGDIKKAIKLYEQALEIDSIYGRSQSIPRDAVYERLSKIR